MKKIYLLVLISIFISITKVQAYDFTAPDVNGNTIYYNYLGGDSVEVTFMDYNYNSYNSDVVIPSTVDYGTSSFLVKRIGEYAFNLCRTLNSIEIPNSVTSIGNYAFHSCSSLTSVTIPDNVRNVGQFAFKDCGSLLSVTIPHGVTNIGDWAFSSCSSLTSITIPSSVTSVGYAVFEYCSNLTSIVVEGDNTKYDSRNNCNAIIETVSNTVIVGCKNTTFSNSITSIGDGAFFGCTGLATVTIPHSVTSIGLHAFRDCSSLTSITIPSSVTSVGQYAFMDCSGLLSVTISNNVTSIESCVFSGCNSLTSVTIPDNVTSVGWQAFSGCSGLVTVIIPNSVTSISTNAFLHCSKLDTMICKANTPPTLGSSVFNGVSSNAVLCVPYESIEAYKAITGYADSFAEIKGFSDVEDITSTTVTLKWLPDTAVTRYDINIYTSDTLFAHYVVDGNGQIIPSQHSAPSIYKQKLDTTVSSTDYFVITLSGLSAGTDYTYTIQGINADNAPIYHEEGSFTTLHEGEEGLFDVILDDPRRQAIKIFRDDQILILRGEKVYTVTGEEVR